MCAYHTPHILVADPPYGPAPAIIATPEAAAPVVSMVPAAPAVTVATPEAVVVQSVPEPTVFEAVRNWFDGPAQFLSDVADAMPSWETVTDVAPILLMTLILAVLATELVRNWRKAPRARPQYSPRR